MDSAMNEWLQIMTKVCDTAAPIKTTTRKKDDKHVPFFTSAIIHLKNQKATCLRLFRKTGDPGLEERLRKITSELRKEKRKQKKNYYRAKVEENCDDGKKLWTILKEITNTATPQNNTEPDRVDADTANAFNNYFANVGRTVQETLGLSDDHLTINMEKRGFTFAPETPEKVEAIIANMNPKVATGYCEIPARILKDLTSVVTQDLTKLINLSYETCTFPQAMKHAWIKCIYKEKGTHNLPDYYRPISILSVVSKLFERSATSQIVEYLESTNGLYSGQHAYRKWHSTTTCLVEITEAIHKELEESRSSGIASMDLSKAFSQSIAQKTRYEGLQWQKL